MIVVITKLEERYVFDANDITLKEVYEYLYKGYTISSFKKNDSRGVKLCL